MLCSESFEFHAGGTFNNSVNRCTSISSHDMIAIAAELLAGKEPRWCPWWGYHRFVIGSGAPPGSSCWLGSRRSQQVPWMIDLSRDLAAMMMMLANSLSDGRPGPRPRWPRWKIWRRRNVLHGSLPSWTAMLGSAASTTRCSNCRQRTEKEIYGPLWKTGSLKRNRQILWVRLLEKPLDCLVWKTRRWSSVCARVRDTFDKCHRRANVTFPEPAKGWIALHCVGLSEEQKAIVKAKTQGSLEFQVAGTRSKKAVGALQADPVLSSADPEVEPEGTFEDVEAFLAESNLTENQAEEIFSEGETAEALLASWSDRRKEINRHGRARRFNTQSSAQSSRSFRIEVEEFEEENKMPKMRQDRSLAEGMQVHGEQKRPCFFICYFGHWGKLCGGGVHHAYLCWSSRVLGCWTWEFSCLADLVTWIWGDRFGMWSDLDRVPDVGTAGGPDRSKRTMESRVLWGGQYLQVWKRHGREHHSSCSHSSGAG